MLAIQALPTIVLGLVAFKVLPDGPATAKWLSDEDRLQIQATLADECKAVSGETGQSGGLLGNPVVWILSAIYFAILIANRPLGFFMPTILHEAGFGSYRAVGNVISVICVLGAAGNIAFSTFSSRFQDIRKHCAAASLASVASLLVLVYVWHSSRPMTFVTLVLALARTGAGVSLFWQIPGQYLRRKQMAIGVPLASSIANVAGFLTPWLTGYVRDVSGTYTSGSVADSGVQALSALLLIVVLPVVARRRGAVHASTGAAH